MIESSSIEIEDRTKSSLKLVELVETPDAVHVQVGHTFNEIFFKTHTFNEIFFEIRGTRGNARRRSRSLKSSLKLVELVETPDPVQVGHTFNEIFFKTHTFNEIFFEIRGTRGNARRRSRSLKSSLKLV